ncbi:MAG: TIGR00730 family Rossman fold protein [Anaerolineales bacterium]
MSSYVRKGVDLRRICVFCGSSDSVPSAYLEAAAEIGELLAERGITIVFGGGSTGLMGALANAALAAGGRVIGVLPRIFNTPALAHAGLTELELVDGMHERKARMAELADGFIALPGGFGTFEELFEVLTWAQIGLHHKPVGVLNIDGYFDPLLALIAHAGDQGFIYAEHQQLLANDREPAGLLRSMEDYQPPEGLARWVDRGGE